MLPSFRKRAILSSAWGQHDILPKNGTFHSRMPPATKIVLSADLTPSDPLKVPVLIVGQLRHLQQVPYATLSVKLQPGVSEEVWKQSLGSVQAGELCPLVVRSNIGVLPSNCSRHCAPSRPAALTRLTKQHLTAADHSVVVVCEKSELYASVCAVARAYPQYSKRTVTPYAANSNNSNSPTSAATVAVEFILVAPTAPAPTGSPHDKIWETPSGDLASTKITKDDIETLNDAIKAIQITAEIVDKPTNEMNVDHFLEEVEAIGKELKLEPVIIRGKKLEEKGFGGIYGVGKAASVPPALAVLSYHPNGATATVAWVGKGIVYDTGGLSIKSKSGMPGMKRDCGGAAAILGAFRAAVKGGFTQNLHAVLCLAENSVGPDATRPDDVHTLYSGRTVEINNTDAEGRLVLADGVTYAQKDLRADIIVDVATLTGAQGIAVGKYHAAVLTNSATWEAAVCQAGRVSGDVVFPVPYAPELHFTEFTSAIADMKNSVADRNNAQVSCAGLFIGAQLGWDFPGIWLHVDIAAPSYSGERATGFGTALLAVLFGQYSRRTLLKEMCPASLAQPAQSPAPAAKKARRS